LTQITEKLRSESTTLLVTRALGEISGVFSVVGPTTNPAPFCFTDPASHMRATAVVLGWGLAVDAVLGVGLFPGFRELNILDVFHALIEGRVRFCTVGAEGMGAIGALGLVTVI